MWVYAYTKSTQEQAAIEKERLTPIEAHSPVKIIKPY